MVNFAQKKEEWGFVNVCITVSVSIGHNLNRIRIIIMIKMTETTFLFR